MTTTKTSKRIVMAHPTGNSNARAAVQAFHRSGLLDTFHTCIAVGQDCRNPITKKLYEQRRCEIPQALIQTHPLRDLARLVLQKTGWLPSLRRHEVGPFCVDKVYHHLDQKVAQCIADSHPAPDAIYAYEDGALASFETAQDRNIQRIYELPIGYWRAARRIQTEEAERLPQWAATMPALINSSQKLARKDAELALSNHIIVASRFTADTLKEAPLELPTPHIIPLGCPPPRASVTPQGDRAQPLKVLYVGGLSQRKGVAYLLDAVEALGSSVELTLIGKRVGECKPLDDALQKYRWLDSLPHSGILAAMRQHDVPGIPIPL